jgi:hypothetical protein
MRRRHRPRNHISVALRPAGATTQAPAAAVCDDRRRTCNMSMRTGVGFASGLLLAYSLLAAAGATPIHDRVKIIQHVMAKCPMSTSWHAKFATTVMNDTGLRSIVDFEQSFVGGDIGEGPVNETNWGRCFHGESECRGHTIMLCAKNVSRSNRSRFDYRWFDMVTCMDGPDGIPGVTYGLPGSIPNNAAKCAQQVGLPWPAIHTCASGEQGAALLRASHFRTMGLFEGHGGYKPVLRGDCGSSCTWPDHPLGHGYKPPLIPNVWIEDMTAPTYGFLEFNDPLAPARNPYAGLVSRICAAYTGPKPDACGRAAQLDTTTAAAAAAPTTSSVG